MVFEGRWGFSWDVLVWVVRIMLLWGRGWGFRKVKKEGNEGVSYGGRMLGEEVILGFFILERSISRSFFCDGWVFLSYCRLILLVVKVYVRKIFILKMCIYIVLVYVGF